MEARKEEFRLYLEETGVLKALTKALIKLYEMKYDRPQSAVKFIQQHIAENTDDCPTSEQYNKILKELEMCKSKITAYESGGAVATIKQEVVTDENENVVSGPSCVSLNGAKCQLEKLHSDPDCKSLLKKHLTIEMFEKLKDELTKSGKTIVDCINAGLKHPNSSVGIYAADADAYEKFADLFDPIIADYHKFPADQSHPEVQNGWDGDDAQFEDLNSTTQYIKSTRIRCARSLTKYPLNPSMNEEDYLNLMKDVTDVLGTLTDDLEGKFYPLEGMDPTVEAKMIDDHQLFQSGDEHLNDAGALRFWPKGRGIFKNATDTFLVWVNEEDHLRFISMDQSGDIRTTYNRLKDAVTKCSILDFKISKRLGYLTFCPTNLGSTIRASVMISLPKLTAKGTLKDLADQFHLQIRGTHGNYRMQSPIAVPLQIIKFYEFR